MTAFGTTTSAGNNDKSQTKMSMMADDLDMTDHSESSTGSSSHVYSVDNDTAAATTTTTTTVLSVSYTVRLSSVWTLLKILSTCSIASFGLGHGWKRYVNNSGTSRNRSSGSHSRNSRISDRNDASASWNVSCCCNRHAAQRGDEMDNDSNGAVSWRCPFGNDTIGTTTSTSASAVGLSSSPREKSRQSQPHEFCPSANGRNRLVAPSLSDISDRDQNQDDNHYNNQTIEGLVHAALLTHANPRRMLVFLDANEDTEIMDLVCRHVLRYSTVQALHIVTATTTTTPTSEYQSFLSPWREDTSTTSSSSSSSSSWTESSATACRDDARVSVFPLSDIVASIERGQNHSVFADEHDEEGTYDVIVMLDNRNTHCNVTYSQSQSTMEDANDASVVWHAAWYRTLTPNGILVVSQPMSSRTFHAAAAESSSSWSALFRTTRNLEDLGYEAIVDFAVGGGGATASTGAQSHVLLAFKNEDSRERWFRNEAEINLDIAQRLVSKRAATTASATGTAAATLSLTLIDGATMMQYQFTSRMVEEQWCADHDQINNGNNSNNNATTTTTSCHDGHGYHPEHTAIHYNISSLDVRPSTVANGGRGIFAKYDIPKGAALGMDDYVHLIHVPSTTGALLYQARHTFDATDFWTVVLTGYIVGYGYDCPEYGPFAAAVEPGIMSFLNHGCRGTYNTGMELLAEHYHEGTVELGRGPLGIVDYWHNRRAYDPWTARHFPTEPSDVNVALRDIAANTEVLDNYLVFGSVTSLDDWDDNLADLQNMCAGTAVGSVTQYEDKAATAAAS